MKHIRARTSSSATGFSIVELMVAIALGLVITAAISTVFVSSKGTYVTQENLARLQENARFAVQFLIKDIRLSGYFGCLDEISPQTVNNTLKNPSGFSNNAQIPIEGLDGSSSTPKWYPSGATASLPSGAVSASDSLTIRLADPANAVNITKEMPSTSAELDVSTVDGFREGDVIIVSDCAGADIMQVTQVQNAALKLQHAPGGGDATKNPPWPGNETQKLSKAYSPPGGQVMKFKTVRYYVAKGASGNPALFRDTNGGTGEELVDGVERIKILYGKDTDGDRVPNLYLKAGDPALDSSDEWSSVVSLRIGILARTLDDKYSEQDTATYDVDGDGVTDFTAPGDRYKRRIFLSTVLLRNLQ